MNTDSLERIRRQTDEVPGLEFKTTVCKQNYLSPYEILLVELLLVAALLISINNNTVVPGIDQALNCHDCISTSTE